MAYLYTEKVTKNWMRKFLGKQIVVTWPSENAYTLIHYNSKRGQNSCQETGTAHIFGRNCDNRYVCFYNKIVLQY
jgi:hypothetical protein